MRMKKRIPFQEAKTQKNGRKRTKNGYCPNSPLKTHNKNRVIEVFVLERLHNKFGNNLRHETQTQNCSKKKSTKR